MLTIRVHIFASRPADDCSDVPCVNVHLIPVSPHHEISCRFGQIYKNDVNYHNDLTRKKKDSITKIPILITIIPTFAFLEKLE